MKLPPRAVISGELSSKRVKLFADWGLTLPRMAWELGASDPSTTEVCGSSSFAIGWLTMGLGNLFVFASGLTTQVHHL
jgi:hypothetical protein